MNISITKLDTMAELDVPEAAWKALDFLPYKGQRTKLPLAKMTIDGVLMSLKSRHQRRSPEFMSKSSTPTYVTFIFCWRKEITIIKQKHSKTVTSTLSRVAVYIDFMANKNLWKKVNSNPNILRCVNMSE